MRKRLVLLFMVLLAVLGTGSLFGQESAEETLALYANAFDMIWLILSAALVFFMQAGFAMVETGLTRAKNAGNILMKNLMDFSVGAIAFWALGWGLMYGASALGGLAGLSGFFLSYTQEALEAYGVSDMSSVAAGLDVPGRIRRHRRNDRIGSHGGTHEVHRLPGLQRRHLRGDLPDLRSLDMGRRLAFGARLSRLRGIHGRPLGRRMGRSRGSRPARTADR